MLAVGMSWGTRLLIDSSDSQAMNTSFLLATRVPALVTGFDREDRFRCDEADDNKDGESGAESCACM
jgi:hypothetical protein